MPTMRLVSRRCSEWGGEAGPRKVDVSDVSGSIRYKRLWQNMARPCRHGGRHRYSERRVVARLLPGAPVDAGKERSHPRGGNRSPVVWNLVLDQATGGVPPP